MVTNHRLASSTFGDALPCLERETKTERGNTMDIKQKFEDAFDAIKGSYMFMHEDKEAFHFKHKITREYIKVQK